MPSPFMINIQGFEVNHSTNLICLLWAMYLHRSWVEVADRAC